jgi:dienelactone hydrolase
VTSPEQTGLAVLEMLRAGRFAEIRDLFAPQLRAMVTPEALRVGWGAEVDRCGPVTSVGLPVAESPVAGVTVVKIPVTFESGQSTVVISADGEGRLFGVQLAPGDSAHAAEPTSWAPPAYADPARFEEQDVVLGSGPLAVPGTLCLPRGDGPWPAVVLLGGSGPADRDSTIGRNKPFKDLAWGLASRGVAVVRFDKVTYAHGAELAGKTDLTVVDEYLPDASAAVRLLREHPAVDAERVFLLGHSLGGTVSPRVAASEPSVAGLVILAGGVQPMHWAAVRQVRYLASLSPETAAASGPAIEAMTKQAELIDSPDLSASTPAAELLFGVPAPYWLDLRGYDPVATAAALGKPILLLQGGRDYQATVAEDLAGWQAGLAGRSDVSFRVYAGDNHFFFTGEGLSSPAELDVVQHVDSAAVGDIADWMLAGT